MASTTSRIEKKRIHLFGVGIDSVRFSGAVKRIDEMLKKNHLQHVVTVNPEFLMHAKKHAEYRAILNQADLATPDGFGIRLATAYLQLPLTWIPIVREVVAFFQGVWIGWLALMDRRSLHEVPELVTGSDLVPELAKLASERGYSVYFLDKPGGLAPDTAKRAAQRLQLLYPHLKVVGAHTVDPKDSTIVSQINRAKPDLLLVAFGFPEQEYFIHRHKARLKVKVAIGIGGTLDYIVGNRVRPPRPLQGKFEWLWRLLIPAGSARDYWRRIKRIFTAFPLFPLTIYLWKLRWGAGVNQISAVTFDFGGVTNQNGVEVVLRRAWHIVPARQLPALAVFYFRFIQDLERGEIQEVEVWTKFMRYFGTRQDLANLRKRMIDGYTPNEPIWQLVKKIRRNRRLRLAMLTNNVKEWMAIWEARYQLSKYFDPLIASCDVGKRKPNPDIFRVLMKELKLPPSEMVFVDDHWRNVWQARRLGLHAIRCGDPDWCAKTLREILPDNSLTR